MYTTCRQFYPNGIEGESMECTWKEFSNIEKAIKYCYRYSKGIRFARVTIEDETGNELYELLADGQVTDYREVH
ncbi:hypothetical protein [Clostridium estertheticum]|uniref:hypothetical protein n=1 Tax=Clostridium estertheticum TaxID=238834 RepID=UPI001C0BDEBB|nr:hypothetical protein [Clostridium estertheticum]MBU3173382.1 hypothetical protein [Clostridium estertheticum]